MGINETNAYLVVAAVLSCALLITIAITSHYCFRLSSFYFEDDIEINTDPEKLQQLQDIPSEPTDTDVDTDMDEDDAITTDSNGKPRHKGTVGSDLGSNDPTKLNRQTSNSGVNSANPTLCGYLSHLCLDFRDCCLGLFSLKLDVIYSSDVGMSLNAANRHRYPNWTVRTSNYFIAFSIGLFLVVLLYSIFWDEDMLSDTDNINYNTMDNYTSVPWILYIIWYILVLFTFWTLFRWTQFVISKYHGMLCFVFEVFYEVNHGYWRYYVMTRDFRKFDKLRSPSEGPQSSAPQEQFTSPFRLPTNATALGGHDSAPDFKLGASIQNSIDFERAQTNDDMGGSSVDVVTTGPTGQENGLESQNDNEKHENETKTKDNDNGEIEMEEIDQKTKATTTKKSHGRKRIATDADEVIHQLFDVGKENETLAREDDEIQSLNPYKPLWYVMMRDKYHIYYYNELISNLIGDWPYYNQYKFYVHIVVILMLLYFSLHSLVISESNNYGVFVIWIGYGLAIIANMLHDWEDEPYDECDYDARRSLPRTMYKISEEIEFAQGYLQLFEIINVLFCVLFWFSGIFYQIVVLIERIWNQTEYGDSFENSEYYEIATGNTIENPYYLWRINKFNKFIIFILLVFVCVYAIALGIFYFVTVLLLPNAAFKNMTQYIDHIQTETQAQMIETRKTEDQIVGLNDVDPTDPAAASNNAPSETEPAKAKNNSKDNDNNKNVSQNTDNGSLAVAPPRGARMRKYTTVRNILSKEDFQWNRKDGIIVDSPPFQSQSAAAGNRKDTTGSNQSKSPKKNLKIMVSDLDKQLITEDNDNEDGGGDMEVKKQASFEDEPLVKQYNENLDYKDMIQTSSSITDVNGTFGKAIREEILKKSRNVKSIQINSGDDDNNNGVMLTQPDFGATKSIKSIELIEHEKDYKHELHKPKSDQDSVKMAQLKKTINNEKKRRRILWMLRSNLSLIHMLSWQNRFDAFEICVDFAIKAHCLDHILAFIEFVQFRLFVIKMEKYRYNRVNYADKDFTGKYDAKWDYWEWPGLKFANKVPKSYIVFHDYGDEIKHKMRTRTLTTEQIIGVGRAGGGDAFMASSPDLTESMGVELTNLLKGSKHGQGNTSTSFEEIKRDGADFGDSDGNETGDDTNPAAAGGSTKNAENKPHDDKDRKASVIKSDKEQFQEYLYKAYQLFLKYHKLIYSIHRFSKSTPYRENDETLNKYVYYRLRKLFKNEKRVLLCDVSKAAIDFKDIKSTDADGQNSRLEWNRDNIYSIFDLTCLLIIQDLKDKMWNEFQHSYQYDQYQHGWNLEIARRLKNLRRKVAQQEHSATNNKNHNENDPRNGSNVAQSNQATTTTQVDSEPKATSANVQEVSD